MKYFDRINSHKYLEVAALHERTSNDLEIIIEEARPTGVRENVKIGDAVIPEAEIVAVTNDCSRYRINFGEYVAYSIINESYTTKDEYGKYEGNLFRVYSRSHFLDYVKKASFATDEYPGPLKHYCLVCSDHVIDVISNTAPEIELQKGT